MKFRSFGRYIGWRFVLLGQIVGALIWAADTSSLSQPWRVAPLALLEVPGVPHPSLISIILPMLCMFFWGRHQLLADSLSRQRAKGDFFFCLSLSTKTFKGIISVLTGIASFTFACYAKTGSQSALLACMWTMLVIAQQAFVLSMLLNLAAATKWSEPRFALF